MRDTIVMIVVVLVVVALGFLIAQFLQSDTVADPRGAESAVASSSLEGLLLPGGMATREVVFDSTDGIRLPGTLSVPNSGSPVKGPAILLIHGEAGSRADVARLAEALLADGYAVLSYDSRDLSSLKTDAARTDALGKDAAAARSFLALQPEVDSSQVGVVALSLSGNALQGASLSGVKAVALISPKTSPLPANLHTVFVASYSADAAGADAVFKKTADPKVRRVYDGSGAPKDLAALPQAIDDIISFFAQHLDVKG